MINVMTRAAWVKRKVSLEGKMGDYRSSWRSGSCSPSGSVPRECCHSLGVLPTSDAVFNSRRTYSVFRNAWILLTPAQIVIKQPTRTTQLQSSVIILEQTVKPPT